MKTYNLYSGGQYEIMETQGEKCIVYDKSSNKYYKKECSFSALNVTGLTKRRIRVQLFDIFVYVLIMGAPLALAWMIYKTVNFEWKTYDFSPLSIVWAILFAGINIIIHEFSHLLSMKAYGLPKAKLGVQAQTACFKFYVNTTPAYLLPPYKQFIVHIIGIVCNIYLFTLVYALADLINEAPVVICSFSIIFVLLNFLPVSGNTTDIGNIISMLKTNRRKEVKL